MRAILIYAATAGLAGTVTVYGFAAIATAAHYVLHCHRLARPASCRGFLHHTFPPILLRSHWTRLDIAVFVTNKLLFTALLPSSYAILTLTTTGVRTGLLHAGIRPLAAEPGPLLIAAFGLLTLLARDFVGFYAHLFQHRIPILWELHKVHHAPPSLVPLTNLRLHPMELLLNIAAESVSVGLLAGLWGTFIDEDPSRLVLQTAGFYTIVNVITLSPLRHSHIDIRFGWAERIILSPAHHQLHHSIEQHHWDKNFAAIFTLWDRSWNTLAEPPGRESYRLGLPGGESDCYATWYGCYVTPFAKVWRLCRRTGLWPSLVPAPIASHPAPLVPVPGKQPQPGLAGPASTAGRHVAEGR